VATPGRITSSRERDRERRRERRNRRGRRVLRWVIALLALAVSFFAGLAVGRAVEGQHAQGDQTLVRTLLPATLTAPETVTVKVSKP
jgi:cytochrome bd-type quinol oxidase subunit 2